MTIRFSKPYVAARSLDNVQAVLKSAHQQGDGPFSEKSVQLLSKFNDKLTHKLTPSCTASLEIASRYLELMEDDEVILPDFTFTSAAVAVTQFRAKPIFVDIDSKTKCIDTKKIEEKITSRTKAISWVNYGGEVPDLLEIKEISSKYNLVLIEDNAHSLGTSLTGKTGDFVTQSFHATKNIQCGEGGSIGFSSKIELEQIEILREKGTNRNRFLSKEVKKYEWVNEGSSYLLSEINAAVLYSQLLEYNEIQLIRQKIFDYYASNLGSILDENNIIWSNSNNHRNAAHMFFIDFKSHEISKSVIEYCNKQGLEINRHYQSLSNSIYGKKKGFDKYDCTESENTSRSLVRLPLYPSLIPQLEEVIEIFLPILKSLLRKNNSQI